MAEEYRRAAGRQSFSGAAVRHGRRRNTVNLYTTVAAAIISALGSLLSVNVLFNLSPTRLTINGVSLYTPQQIQQVSGLVPGQNLVRLNTDYIERRLTQHLVYIDKVSVLKEYPDGLIINIIEAKPVVQIEYDGGYCTMSKSGRLLEIGRRERDPRLPIVTGYELTGYETPSQKAARLEAELDDSTPTPKKPEITAGTRAVSDDDQKTEILSELLAKLDSLNFNGIAKIDINERTDIKLVYDGRIQIELGSSVELDIKLTYIKAVIDKELPEGYEGTLRYNGIDRGISAIPKKTDVPISVTKPGTTTVVPNTTIAGRTDTSSADPNAMPPANPANPANPQNAGNDNSSNNAYDPNAGYNYNYGYDPGYGYNDYDYGYYDNGGYDYDYYDYGTW